MNHTSIKQLVSDIKTATAQATSSKAAAVKFLKDAGIMKHLPKSKSTSTVSKVKGR